MGRPRSRTTEVLVLNKIAELTARWGEPPTVRELALTLGYLTPSAVYRYMVRLRDDGRLGWNRNQARSMKVVDDGETWVPTI